VLTITIADEGKTFHVKLGATVNVILQADAGMDKWVIQPPDPAVLAPAANPPAGLDVIANGFRAAGAGTATLSATDRPSCAPGQVCPRFIRAWRVTVVVDAA